MSEPIIAAPGEYINRVGEYRCVVDVTKDGWALSPRRGLNFPQLWRASDGRAAHQQETAEDIIGPWSEESAAAIIAQRRERYCHCNTRCCPNFTPTVLICLGIADASSFTGEMPCLGTTDHS